MSRQTRRLDNLKRLFIQYGIRPSTHRGQNFLLDVNQVRYIARLGDLGPDDVVLEVGPGTGFLSQEVAPHVRHLLAVELDRKLAQLVRGEMADAPEFELMEADILAGKNAVNPDVLDRLRELLGRVGPIAHLKSVSNLPYSAGTPFAMNLFSSDLPWERAVFLLQYEVAQRMAAGPGSDAYGTLSITCALGGKVKIQRKVPPPVFWPRPQVSSAVVTIDFNPLEERQRLPWKALRRVTSSIFSSRRKRLRNSLKGLAEPDRVDAALAELALPEETRGEELTPEQILILARALPESEAAG